MVGAPEYRAKRAADALRPVFDYKRLTRLVIIRFQIFHEGYLALIRRKLAEFASPAVPIMREVLAMTVKAIPHQAHLDQLSPSPGSMSDNVQARAAIIELARALARQAAQEDDAAERAP